MCAEHRCSDLTPITAIEWLEKLVVKSVMSYLALADGTLCSSVPENSSKSRAINVDTSSLFIDESKSTYSQSLTEQMVSISF